MIAIGVDIGGTFTDFVLETGGVRHALKLPTTPDAPERAVLDGIDRLLAAHAIAPSALGRIIHGTTLATNAVIERRGARVGFLTTEGFRDTLEMGNESRHDQYDLLVDKPPPLVPRGLRLVARERLAAGGRVLTPLNEDDVRAAAATFRAEGVEAVAVGFLHAFANPAHEHRAAAILADLLPGVPICLAADVAPEIREYDRFSTVCANAYVRPLMQGYLGRLATALTARGIAAPLLLMQSNGGLCDLETARRFPVRLLESGPAGGAIFAAGLARRLSIREALLLDVGGTTAKLCLIDDGQPQTARFMEVARIDRFKPGSGLPVRLPVVELCEIGAGGGSLARVDRLGRLLVGPRSAGSQPGPACYGRGGTQATVTDAHAVRGHLDPATFAGGTMVLDPALARHAIETDIAAPLVLDAENAAAGIVAIMNETMATAAREHAIDAGKGLAGRTLIAIGGAAGLHAVEFARAVGITDIVVPAEAGVGSAVGFLEAPVAFERAMSRHEDLATIDAPATAGLLRGLADDCAREVARAAPGPVDVTLVGQMRYRGQGYEIPVPVPQAWLVGGDGAALRALFEAAYLARFGRVMQGAPAEIMGWTVRAAAPPPTTDASLAGAPDIGDVPGPALLDAAGCTVRVPEAHAARGLPGGHIRIGGSA